MLQFFYGRAATGKSYTIFQKIKEDVDNGKSVVLLVPEQFTFESERTLLSTFKEGSSTDVSVLSFTRLYDEVSRKTGGRTADTITEFDRVLLVFRAINEVADRLNIWGRYKKSPHFASTLAGTITELKTSSISSSALKKVGESIEEKYLSDKINDLALIYDTYNALLGNAFLDPADSMTRLADKLLDYKYFENKTVYIDAFSTFTGQQYKIIERILQQANDVYCSLTTDNLDSKDDDTFSNIRKIAQKFIRLAQKYNCVIAEPIEFKKHNYKNDELFAVEKSLLNSDNKYEKSTEFITLCKCETILDEAKFAAHTIRKLVNDRSNGYRYRDFVIICRDAQIYQKSVESACDANDVFCFSDRRKNITYLPLTMFITSLLELSQSFTTVNILNLLKTGLGPINGQQLIDLSNYIYLWNITGKDWSKEWNMNPREFGEMQDYYRSAAENELANINSCKTVVLTTVNEFLNDFNGTPTQMVNAVINCLKKCDVSSKLKQINNTLTADGLLVEADDNRQCWDIVMEIFDGIVKCMPDREINKNEFIDSWRLAVNYTTIGNIPQMLDEVTFGSADRIKPSRPKVAFVLGLNQNVFPKAISSSGIFADNEREKLISNGLELSNTALADVIYEDFLAYTSLCCPTERLYVSYCTSESPSKSAEPSIVISTLKNAIPNITEVSYPEKGLKNFLPLTIKTAEERMCDAYATDDLAFNTLQYALKDKSNISVDAAVKSFDKKSFTVSEDRIENLFGKNVYLSATQFDQFHHCKFAYFCRFALKLKKIEPAEFNPLQRGTIVHYVMQRFIDEHKNEMESFDRSKCNRLSQQYIDEFLSKIPGYKDIETPRLCFLVDKISLIVRDVVYHIVCEFAQSGFVPQVCELKIGEKMPIESAPIKINDDAAFYINGSIDRVDTWNGYIRVVDYKTGSKDFALPDVLLGLNMQMLIYLYSIMRCPDNGFNSLKPAGVLYMPAVRENSEQTMCMNGIILNDEDVLYAMEEKNEGEYVPKRELTKKGTARGNTFVSEELFETLFDYIEVLFKRMGNEIYKGNFSANPTDGNDGNACTFCNYYSICCIEDFEHVTSEKRLSNEKVLSKIKEVQ